MRRRWKVLIGALVVLAILLTLNTIAVDHETKAAKVDVAGGRILSLTDGDIQVKEDGAPSDPPIVLLHGYTGSINWWNAITPLLAKDHHVIRIDLLGHGGSEKPANGYSMKNQAELVAEAMNQLGVAGATVVGHSMGGAVATALAATSPELVSRLVFIDSGPDNSYSRIPLKQKLSRKPVIGQLIWRTAPHSQIKDGLKSAFGKGFPVPDVFADDLQRMTYSSYKSAFQELHGYLGEQSLPSRLQSLAVPLLVIWGAEDRFILPSGAQAYSSVPGAEIETIPGSGHTPQVEKPQETANLILQFARAGEAQIANELEKARHKKEAAARKAAAKRRKSRSKHKASRKHHSKARR